MNIKTLLEIFEKYTFDCPMIYYNKGYNTIKYINFNKKINWDVYEYTWSNDWTKTSSSTLRLNNKPIMELQFHTKSRHNMAIRWDFNNYLEIFKDLHEIIEF